jgi:aminoglycoside 6'-N-acetyltransferase
VTAPSALHGQRVVLRPVQPSDLEPFIALFESSGMAEWWPGDPEELAREHVVDEEDITRYAVIFDGAVVGLIQSCVETEPEYRHAGIDIALHPDVHERGLGTDAARTLARHLFDHEGHHRVTIDPAAHNARAIRSYEKVGFRPVGIMREYERGQDGTFHDGLLMDMLREDLTEPDEPA